MTQILYIGIGGFFGSVSRFLVSRFIGGLWPSFPWGTLVVNVSGSFVLGLIGYLVFYGRSLSPDMRGLITIGFIGAYTTMSTFAFESFRIAELSDYLAFTFNILLNVGLCLLAVFLGRQLAILMVR